MIPKRGVDSDMLELGNVLKLVEGGISAEGSQRMEGFVEYASSSRRRAGGAIVSARGVVVVDEEGTGVVVAFEENETCPPSEISSVTSSDSYSWRRSESPEG